MGKSVRSLQVVGGLNRGAWTSLEDKILIDYVKSHREGRWSNVAKVTGLRRCGKSCRLRWMNYLRPDIKRGNISPDEEELILRLHKLLGNRWALIAGRLPGRTDNEIKNYWNTHLAKKTQDQTQSTLFTGSPPKQADHDTNPPPPIRYVQPSFTLGGGSEDPPQLINKNNFDRSFLAPAGPMLTSLDDVVVDTDMKPFPNPILESEHSSDRSSSPTCGGGNVDESQPFMIDFNIDDIYNILDPEFARFDHDGVVLSDLNLNASVDPPGEGQRSDPDIRSLATFLESEAWLADGDHVTGTCGDGE